MKFFSQPVFEHDEVPLADDGRLEELIDYWDESPPSENERQSVYVLSVGEEKDPRVREAQLREIVALVEAQGQEVAGQEIYHLTRIRARTLLGSGTARAVAERARACGAEMLVIDAELSPSQMRNLEDDAGIKVCDREGVILNVFLKNASSRHARIGVEIARLEYLRPRIRGVGIDMDQQMGGVAGSRGPGETASELLARQLDSRLAELKKAQQKISRGRSNRAERREECQRICLVGYTNAGKTSLMNALTSEEFSSKDQPFETLDTVSRSLSRHGETVLISDTVGFIRRLPDRLLNSFESTLAEVKESNLVVIVLDYSDYEWREHLSTTTTVLQRLGASDIERFYVFNKADKVEQSDLSEIEEVVGEASYALLSSRDPQAVATLRERILQCVRREQERRELFVPYTQTATLNLIYAGCRVISTDSEEAGLRVTVEGPRSVIGRIEKSLADRA